MAVMQLFDNVRKDFPFFKQDLAYLDSAATSQKPKVVLDAMIHFYENDNANVHRGVYQLADKATQLYEDARKAVAQFINASPTEIVFVRNATEAINLVAHSFGHSIIGKGDSMLVTEMEHHSNMLPWQRLAKAKGATLDFVPINEDGTLDRKSATVLLAKRPKLFAFTHVSNVLGTINPAKELIAEARKLGIPVLVDAAQSVTCTSVDVKSLDCDFLVFSGHKMLGPHIGVLYAKKQILDKMEPFLVGGGMVKEVSKEKASWKEAPWKFEAGTPDVPSAIGLAAAIKYLQNIGMANVERHARDLTSYAFEQLSKDKTVKIYGPKDRLNVISFNVGDMHAHDVSTLLDEQGVLVRAGHHCAHPLMQKLDIPACVRLSVGVYSTMEDVDRFLAALQKAKKVFRL